MEAVEGQKSPAAERFGWTMEVGRVQDPQQKELALGGLVERSGLEMVGVQVGLRLYDEG